LTQPPDDFVVKNFLETLTKDENVDTLSQSIKEARTIWNRKSGNIWTVNRKSSLVQGDSSFWGLSLRECKGSAHVGCKFHTSYKKAERIVSNERIQKWHNDVIVINLRKWSELTCGQRILGAQLLFHLYQMCVAEISKSVPLNEREESHTLKVSDIAPDGRRGNSVSWRMDLLEKSWRYVVENR
jgi:hypothetical protein